MPYKISKSGGGYKVTTPNHPHGFSKKPQSHEQASAQLRAIMANTKEQKPRHQQVAEQRAKELKQHERDQKKRK